MQILAMIVPYLSLFMYFPKDLQPKFEDNAHIVSMHIYYYNYFIRGLLIGGGEMIKFLLVFDQTDYMSETRRLAS